MTPANAVLLEQITAALDSPPNARSVADLQALRDGLRRHFGQGPAGDDIPERERGRSWTDAELLACVDQLVANNATTHSVSMTTLADAAEATALRDRVRAAERRAAEIEADVIDLRNQRDLAIAESSSARTMALPAEVDRELLRLRRSNNLLANAINGKLVFVEIDRTNPERPLLYLLVAPDAHNDAIAMEILKYLAAELDGHRVAARPSECEAAQPTATEH